MVHVTVCRYFASLELVTGTAATTVEVMLTKFGLLLFAPDIYPKCCHLSMRRPVELRGEIIQCHRLLCNSGLLTTNWCDTLSPNTCKTCACKRCNAVTAHPNTLTSLNLPKPLSFAKIHTCTYTGRTAAKHTPQVPASWVCLGPKY